VQFDVVVDGTGACEDPSYTWEIAATGCTGNATGSSIGSTLDANGLYTAGNEAGTDIVRVTDVNNGDVCAAAEVIVRKGAIPPPPPPPSGCKTDDDCDDGVFCNGAETCTGGNCVDGNPPCRAELCDEETDTCIGCLVDEDCDDGVDCTDDSCVDEICENTPNDDSCPDDGLFCNGEEFCDEAEGCSSTGDPCGAGETCDEDTDSCVGAGVCSIDVVPETLPKSHWIPLGPGIIRINTVDVNPTSFTPVTITCDTDGMGFAPRAVPVSLIKFVIGDVIFQPVIVQSALATGSLEMENETCTVTVGDCKDTDTFDLQYLNFGGIPLSD
jgi:hypothetical protein